MISRQNSLDHKILHGLHINIKEFPVFLFNVGENLNDDEILQLIDLFHENEIRHKTSLYERPSQKHTFKPEH